MQGKKKLVSLYFFFQRIRACVFFLSLYRVGLLHKDREAEKITIEFVWRAKNGAWLDGPHTSVVRFPVHP